MRCDRKEESSAIPVVSSSSSGGFPRDKCSKVSVRMAIASGVEVAELKLPEDKVGEEGVVLWMKSTSSRNPVQTTTSPTRTAPKPSYSQVTTRCPPEPMIKPGQQPATKENLQPCDPGKSPPCDLAHDLSCDLQGIGHLHDHLIMRTFYTHLVC